MSRGEEQGFILLRGQEGRGEVTGYIAGTHTLVWSWLVLAEAGVGAQGTWLAEPALCSWGAHLELSSCPLVSWGGQMCLDVEDFRTKWLR